VPCALPNLGKNPGVVPDAASAHSICCCTVGVPRHGSLGAGCRPRLGTTAGAGRPRLRFSGPFINRHEPGKLLHGKSDAIGHRPSSARHRLPESIAFPAPASPATTRGTSASGDGRQWPLSPTLPSINSSVPAPAGAPSQSGACGDGQVAAAASVEDSHRSAGCPRMIDRGLEVSDDAPVDPGARCELAEPNSEWLGEPLLPAPQLPS
jgi:hypothetical protein